MAEERIDIYSILESFLRESFSAQYGEKELDHLVESAKSRVRERTERPLRKKEDTAEGPMPRKGMFVRDPDIEDRLLESLKQRVDEKGEDQ
jgi:hypothetical protein